MTRDERDPHSSFDNELQEFEEGGQSEWDRKSAAGKVIFALITVVVVAGLLVLSFLGSSTTDEPKTERKLAEPTLGVAKGTDRKLSSCNLANFALDRAVRRVKSGDANDFESFSIVVTSASEIVMSASADVGDSEVREILQEALEALVGMEVAIELSGDSESTIQYAKDAIESETKELDRQVAALDSLCKGVK